MLVTSPAATLVILLLPALIPVSLILTTFVGSVFAITNPSVSMDVSPILTLPLAPKSISSANFTVMVESVVITPILFSVSPVVLPPLMIKVLPNFLCVEPLSPVNVIGRFTAVLNPVSASPTLL